MSINSKEWQRPDDAGTTLKVDMRYEQFFKDGYIYSLTDFMLVQEPDRVEDSWDVPPVVTPGGEFVTPVPNAKIIQGQRVWYAVMVRVDDREQRIAIRYTDLRDDSTWQRIKNAQVPVRPRGPVDLHSTLVENERRPSANRGLSPRRGATRTRQQEDEEGMDLVLAKRTIDIRTGEPV